MINKFLRNNFCPHYNERTLRTRYQILIVTNSNGHKPVWGNLHRRQGQIRPCRSPFENLWAIGN